MIVWRSAKITVRLGRAVRLCRVAGGGAIGFLIAALMVLMPGLLTGCQTDSTPAAMNTASRRAAPAPQKIDVHPALPAEVRAAVARLGSPDVEIQRAAFAEVGSTFSSYINQTALLQQLAGQVRANTAAELRTMTAQRDPEVAARMARVLAFNEGLANFTMAVLDAPPERREALIRWGFGQSAAGGGMGDIIGLAFSGRVEDRVEAAWQLTDAAGDEVDWVLAQLIADEEREVSLAALDAVWDRAPSPQVVEALWKKAVVYPLALNGYHLDTMVSLSGGDSSAAQGEEYVNTNNAPIFVRVGDRTVQLNDNGNSQVMNRANDSDMATEVLLSYRSPLVAQKLDGLFALLGDARGENANFRNAVLSVNYGGAAINVQRLIEGYRSRGAIQALVQMVLTPGNDGWENAFGAQMFRCSSRIDALASLVKLTDMDRDDFKLVRRPEYGTRWLLSGRLEDEEAAVKKIREWWAAHKTEYGG